MVDLRGRKSSVHNYEENEMKIIDGKLDGCYVVNSNVDGFSNKMEKIFWKDGRTKTHHYCTD